MTNESGRPACIDAPCRSHAEGHAIHPIHATIVGREPWGWREVLVTRAEGGTLELLEPVTGAIVRAWHHADLTAIVEHGDLIGLHVGRRVLRARACVVHVALEGPLRPVPPPANASEWRVDGTPGVVDLSTGTALDLP